MATILRKEHLFLLLLFGVLTTSPLVAQTAGHGNTESAWGVVPIGDRAQLAADGWEKRTSSKHLRAEGQIITYRGEFYHFNGFDSGLLLQSNNEKYNPTTDTWTPLAPHPLGPDGEEIAATHVGIALVDDVVWIVGGRIGSHPGKVTSAVYLYDISADSWSKGPALPAPRGAGGLARLGRKLHWVGGFDALAQCDADDHWVYDLDNPRAGWQDYTDSSPMPNARNHFGTTVLGGKLYAVGGQYGHDGCLKGKNMRLVHVYDPLTDKWTRLADLPDVQSHTEPSTFTYNKKIYSLGGQAERSDEVWEYTPEEDRWRVRDDLELPLRLIAPGARVHDEVLYVMVGGEIAVNVPARDVRATYFGKNTEQDLGFYPATFNVNASTTSNLTALLVNYSAEDEVIYRIDASALPDWVRVNRTSGTARESFAEVTVSVDTSQLAAGTYSYPLRATAAGYEAAELRITVTVQESPAGDESPDEPVAPEAPEPPSGPEEPTPAHLAAELECAQVGSSWDIVVDESASGSAYLTPATGKTSKTALPADVADNQVRVTITVPEAGVYQLFARVAASTNLDDSFYFRVNGGSWINWGNGLQTKGPFDWRRYGAEEFLLAAGPVAIDITYRENGLKIDKISLSTSNSLPTGLGPELADCEWEDEGDVPPEPQPEPTPDPCATADCVTAVLAEAECATATGAWQLVKTNRAGTAYQVAVGASSYAMPGASATSVLTFKLDVPTAGTYYPYFRLDAPTNANNSMWVRIDGGDWMKFWRETTGKNMLTSGFEWRRLTDDLNTVTLTLAAGSHTLEVANRESGTGLDKVVLQPEEVQPENALDGASDCNRAAQNSSASLAAQTGVAAFGSAASEAPVLSLFPNPVGQTLTVRLVAEQIGTVAIRIVDVHGRTITQREYQSTSTEWTERLDVSLLPAGMYRLAVRLGDEQQRIVRTFVKGS
ncbi:N-acetylneuraminate epimerase [Neolewinella maritima]|uniref:N-acetylneuraminate epimerase n=1 Tax=Neolewinella maritima TaxID=1383882 RepID=A0ABN8F9Q4_9BACT|nr:kelch repeat-containing protein [Neolewinella maritima]CAH1001989.1 N-acetylneuraminate epimerase [Neolewinella maritima]